MLIADATQGRERGPEPLPEMSTVHKVSNMVGVVLPFVGFVVAVALLWNRAVDLVDLALFVGTYVPIGFGVTVGFHRLLTHRSFQAPKAVEYGFAILGSMALQGSVIHWVADHRKHHAHTDSEGDPHSPHVGHGSGLRGLWHAHTGWLFDAHGRADLRRYAPDLMDDPGMRRIDRLFPLWTLLSLAIPFALGWLLHGDFEGALRGLVWGGLVRIFFLHHVTWSINSVCHFFGRRRFDLDDHSTNVAWLALPSFGEAWHHNHHAFPRSASHGLRRWELDPSALVIKAMRRVGLARNVITISPERQAQRERASVPAAR